MTQLLSEILSEDKNGKKCEKQGFFRLKKSSLRTETIGLSPQSMSRCIQRQCARTWVCSDSKPHTCEDAAPGSGRGIMEIITNKCGAMSRIRITP